MNDEFDLGIEEEVKPAGKTTVKNTGKVKEANPNQKHRIIVSETEGGPGYVAIGVNGVVTQIQCGIPVDVGIGVLNVLREATATRYKMVARAEGKEELVGHEVPAVPFQYLGVVE
jgi:hypothetical protein